MFCRLLQWVYRELKLWLYILRFDNFIFILCGFGFTLSAIVTKNPDSLYDILCYCFQSIIYTTLYILLHCLPNQYYGVEEDKLNKPWRPLVAGYMTMQGALNRYYIVAASYLAFSIYYIQLLPVSLLYLVLVYLMHNKNFNQNYVTKMLYVPLGNMGLSLNPWLIVTNIEINCLVGFAYINYVTLIIAFTQDIRDVRGDIAVERKTLPVVLGVQKIKNVSFWLLLVNSVVLLIGPALLLHYNIVQCNVRPEFFVFHILLQFGISSCCVYRMLSKSSYQDEYITYCCILAQFCCSYYFPSFISIVT